MTCIRACDGGGGGATLAGRDVMTVAAAPKAAAALGTERRYMRSSAGAGWPPLTVRIPALCDLAKTAGCACGCCS